MLSSVGTCCSHRCCSPSRLGHTSHPVQGPLSLLRKASLSGQDSCLAPPVGEMRNSNQSQSRKNQQKRCPLSPWSHTVPSSLLRILPPPPQLPWETWPKPAAINGSSVSTPASLPAEGPGLPVSQQEMNSVEFTSNHSPNQWPWGLLNKEIVLLTQKPLGLFWGPWQMGSDCPHLCRMLLDRLRCSSWAAGLVLWLTSLPGEERPGLSL